MSHNHAHLRLAQHIAVLLAELPQVQAIALSGSQGSQMHDHASDIDLYVYTTGDIPVEQRANVMQHSGGATRADIGLNYWGPGDEWIDAASGIEVDLVYFDAGWIQDQLRRLLEMHQPNLGYTTCFWHTVRSGLLLFDRDGWYASLQALADRPYPDALRQNIIAWNLPVLRGVIPALARQIEKAAQRNDRVSLNHRLAALLASYFDIIFALNRVLHPGEKRLLTWVEKLCPLRPSGMRVDVEALLRAAGENAPDLTLHLDRLLINLEALLEQQGFDPHNGSPLTA